MFPTEPDADPIEGHETSLGRLPDALTEPKSARDAFNVLFRRVTRRVDHSGVNRHRAR